MKLSDLVRQKGITERAEQKPEAPASSFSPRRRYFWDEDNQQPEQAPAKTEAKTETPVLAVSSALVQPLGTPLETAPSSSSRSNKELLTTAESNSIENSLDALWDQIDTSPLSDIRFGKTQVAQIAQRGSLTPEQLQDSIYAFSFDLSKNNKAKSISGPPLNYFMGILRKGPYAPPANYESPEDLQQRLYLEAKEQQRKSRLERENRLETVEFEEWLESLKLDQRNKIVPPTDYAKAGGTAHTMQLREYFRETVWPALKERSKEGVV